MDDNSNQSNRVCPSVVTRFASLLQTYLRNQSDSQTATLTATIPMLPLFLDALIPDLNIFSAFVDGIEWFIGSIVEVVISVVPAIFVIGMEPFLFFKNPVYIEGLNSLWNRLIPLYFAILFIGFLLYLLVMMLFPNDDDTDVHRMVDRTMVSIVTLIVARPFLGFAIAFVQGLQDFFYPGLYNIQFANNLIEILVGGAGGLFVMIYMTVFYSGSLILAGLVFYVLLAVRMLLIYTIYGLFPLFLAFWVFDVGPMKYANMVAEMMFKALAIFLAFGVIVAAMLAVGAAIGSGVDGSQMQFSTEGPTNVHSVDPHGPGTTFGSGTDVEVDAKFATAQSGQSASTMVRLFAFLATLWILIALGSSMFGVLMSASASSPGGAGGMRGRSSATYGGGGRGSGSAVGAPQPPAAGQSTPGAGGGQPMSVSEMDTRTPFTQKAKNVASPVGQKMEGIGDRISDIGGESTVTGGVTDAVGAGFKDAGAGFSSTRSRLGGALTDGRKWVGNNVPGSSSVSRAAEMAKNAGGVYGDMVRSSGGVEALQIGADGLRNSRIGNKHYPDSEYVGGISGEQVNWAPPEKINEQVGHTYGEATEGYGVDPTGAGGRDPAPDRLGDAFNSEAKWYGGRRNVDLSEDLRSTYDSTGRLGGEPVTPAGGDTASADAASQPTAQTGGGLDQRETGEFMQAGDAEEQTLIGGVTTAEARTKGKGMAQTSKMGAAGKSGASNAAAKSAVTDLGFDPKNLDYETLFNNSERLAGMTGQGINASDIEEMLQHQKVMGASPTVAAARTSEMIHRPEVKRFSHGPNEFLSTHGGMEAVPEQVETSTADRCVRVDTTGVTVGGNVYRYEHGAYTDAEERLAFGKDASTAVGTSSLVGEEAHRRLGTNTTRLHYDPSSGKHGFLRSEGVQGNTLSQLRRGDAEDLVVSTEDLDIEAYQDTVANMTLTGNDDLNSENVIFTEDGSPVVIDHDHTGANQLVEENVDREVERMAYRAADNLERAGVDINKDEFAAGVKQRVNEIAENTDPEQFRAEVPQDVQSRLGVDESAETVNDRLHENVEGSREWDAESVDDYATEEQFMKMREEAQFRGSQIASNIEQVRENYNPETADGVTAFKESTTAAEAASGSLGKFDQAATEISSQVSGMDRDAIADQLEMEVQFGSADTVEDAKQSMLDNTDR